MAACGSRAGCKRLAVAVPVGGLQEPKSGLRRAPDDPQRVRTGGGRSQWEAQMHLEEHKENHSGK